jgi:peptidyl-prolyl cis-trans isomerase C
MKYVGFSLLSLLWICTSVFSQSGTYYISPKKENLLTVPNGDKMGELVSGTKVVVLEKKDKWVKVQCTGWILEKSLTDNITGVEGYTVRAAHILLESENDAKTVLTQLNQGVSFEDLALKYSIDQASGAKGGDLGRFGKGDFKPDFEQAVFRLKVGEVSGIIKTDLGYHIIKRLE